MISSQDSGVQVLQFGICMVDSEQELFLIDRNLFSSFLAQSLKGFFFFLHLKTYGSCGEKMRLFHLDIQGFKVTLFWLVKHLYSLA